MIQTLNYLNNTYHWDTEKGIDISIPIKNGSSNPRCFNSPKPKFNPFITQDFVGSVAEGGPVNFFKVEMYPHGHGTHTECVGHILPHPIYITDVLTASMFIARLISVYPQALNSQDQVISVDFTDDLVKGAYQALIVRTYPNQKNKKTMNYSNTNPPYFTVNAIKKIVDLGIQHLLVDIPSIDKERDGGLLQGHKTFWNSGEKDKKSITELIYVPNRVPDGIYLLDLQIISLKLDVSPSKPILYRLEKHISK